MVKKHIAIVGAGLQGLFLANALKRKFHVTVFDSRTFGSLGTVEIESTKSNRKTEIYASLPLNLFYLKENPNFKKYIYQNEIPYFNFGLLKQFQRPTGRVAIREKKLPLLDYCVHIPSLNLRYLGTTFSTTSLIQYIRTVMNWNLKRTDDKKVLWHQTISDFIYRKYFCENQAKQVIYPLLASYLETPVSEISKMPSLIAIRYFLRLTGSDPVCSLVGGLDRLRYSLLEGIEEFYESIRVVNITRKSSKANSTSKFFKKNPMENDKVYLEISDGSQYPFDHVVLSTGALEAKNLVADQSSAVLKILEEFESTRRIYLGHKKWERDSFPGVDWQVELDENGCLINKRRLSTFRLPTDLDMQEDLSKDPDPRAKFDGVCIKQIKYNISHQNMLVAKRLRKSQEINPKASITLAGKYLATDYSEFDSYLDTATWVERQLLEKYPAA